MKWLIIALICLLPNLANAQGGMGPGPGTVHSTGGGGTVTFDAKTPAGAFVSSGTSVSNSTITVGSGSGRALIVGFVVDTLTVIPPAAACVWDVGGTNQSMTAITGTNTGINGGISAASVLFGLLAPTSGAKTLTCTWTGSNAVGIFAVSFTGVNQGSLAAAFPNGTFTSVAIAAAGPVSIAITSATGHKTVAMFAQNCVAFGAISGTTITTELDMTNVGWVSSYDNGAATVTMTAAFTGTCDQIASGTDVSP